MRASIRNTVRRYQKRKKGKNVLLKKVIEDLWGIDAGSQRSPSGRFSAYLDHYINLTPLLSTSSAFQTDKYIADLIKTVQQHASDSISDICNALKQSSSQWLKSSFSEEEALQSLQFALKLWLFADPQLDQPGKKLSEVNCSLLDTSTRTQSTTGLLSADFSAKSLTRKGGFYLRWTSDLSEHLTFASKDQLRVFRHAHALLQYQHGQESALYPPDFLPETYRTINLLFPFEDYGTSKRVKRIARREQVDIEAGMAEKAMEEHEKFQLSSYQYYGPRLAEIQRRYDVARPHRLTQWWYDRRQRPEWAALMVALIVFLLTVLFGIAQTVTGILQVIESRH